MAKKKKSGKILFVLFVIILILIGVGGFYYYNTLEKNEEKKEEKKNNEKKEETAIEKEMKNSIFKDYYKEAIKIVSKMTIEEKIGQLFLVRYDKDMIEKYKNYYPGGYILFAKDFENHTKESMKKELEKDQSLNKYGLILGVDEEGGYVTRISRFKAYREEKFKSPKSYYEEGGYPLLEQMENEKMQLLKSLGINLNLAPVADISMDEDDFMYTRSFGRGKEETSEFVGKMVEIANQNGISSCLKHFPGYGNNQDTHTGIAIDTRSYENFIENDFLPFQEGIKKKVPSILVSHNIVKAMDEKYPASLSKNVIHELRDILSFTGIIMTDDLAMDAVKEYVENNEAATLAINAGNDMIITSDFMNMYEELLSSYKNKKIEEDTIDRAVVRIISWKLQNKVIE